MAWIFALASAAFWVGVALDARSSIGGMERTRLWRRSDGRFSLSRYLAAMAVFYAVVLTVVVVSRDTLALACGSGVLVFGAVVRLRIAARNRKIQGR